MNFNKTGPNDTLRSIANRNNASVLSTLQSIPRARGNGINQSQTTLNLVNERNNAPEILVHAYSGNASASEIEPYLPYISALTVQNAARISGDNVVMTRDISPYTALGNKYRTLILLGIDNMDERGRYNKNIAENILQSPNMTENFINSAIAGTKNSGSDGLEVSFAGITEPDKYNYADMLLALKGIANEENLHLFSPFIPTQNSFTVSDENIIDTTDFTPIWNYIWDDTASASPAAPYDQISDLLTDPVVQKYGNKMLLGLPTFATDFIKTGNGYTKNAISSTDALKIVNSGENTTEFDENSRTPFVRYTENNRRSPAEHIIRYEDARSISEKLNLLDSLGLGGVSIMSLDYDLPVLWQILNQRYNILKY